MTTPHRVRAVTDEEIAQVVREVREDGEARVIEADGEAIAVVIGPAEYAELIGDGSDLWAGYDPVKARDALRAARGIFKDLDRERFMRDIKEAREQEGRDFSTTE
ncbi:MAG TPA: hypothetical protein VNM91_06245 [Dehalococcoidia bacterium]|nr:hypothetical protein [Dehalococcoidia bacterium]